MGGPVTTLPVQRRRNRRPHDKTRINQSSFAYRVRIKINYIFCDVPICIKAFIPFHGVTSHRVQTIRESFNFIGTVKPDGSGKHNNRPHQLSNETKLFVNLFLHSLKGRKSHSLKDTDKVYLPEDLSTSKFVVNVPRFKSQQQSFL